MDSSDFMSKVALITDTHHGIRNDSALFLDNQKKFYENIFFPEIEKRGISEIIHLGDLFDRRKFINHRTLFHTNKFFMDELVSRNLYMRLILGNHDTAYKNTNSINSPNLLLKGYGDVIHITESSPEVIEYDGSKMLLVPWINDSNYDEITRVIHDSIDDCNIVCGHFDIAGFEMNKGFVSEHGMSPKLFRDFDRVFSGHFHHKSRHGNIDYLGAPFEFTWGDYDDKRGFHIFDTVSHEIEYIENPYKMFHKIIYDDSNGEKVGMLNIDFSIVPDSYVKVIVNAKNDSYYFDRVLSQIESYNPFDLQVIDVQQTESISDMTDEEIKEKIKDTEQLMSEYIGHMTDVDDSDKKKLSVLMNELYKHSQLEESEEDA